MGTHRSCTGQIVPDLGNSTIGDGFRPETFPADGTEDFLDLLGLDDDFDNVAGPWGVRKIQDLDGLAGDAQAPPENTGFAFGNIGGKVGAEDAGPDLTERAALPELESS
jgi:hypothetical protein